MSTTSRPARRRVPAAERREELISAAVHEFAHGGLYGTPVERIARRVGVAQPYVFSLFGSKRELFLAAVERCFDNTTEVFRQAGEQAPPPQRLERMGKAYVELLKSRETLMMQMQAYAACGDPEVRTVVRRRYGQLVRFIEELSGAEPEAIRGWFATGMLLNVLAAADLDAHPEDWANRLLET
jgi:AcrR family transcriptional regulator